jgi:hypothetical protein
MEPGKIYMSSTTDNIYVLVHGILWAVFEGEGGALILAESPGIGRSETLEEYTGDLSTLFLETDRDAFEKCLTEDWI